jgi:nitroimidazol reductase NimA-like FMN-containing flavoprotein (pyridoxamine 5'-phosphate oxidase superfamily)
VAIPTLEGPPVLTPVTYVLDEIGVLFQSDPGEKVAAVGQHVSFQVDWIDPTHRTGWSVLVQGRLSLVDEEDVRHVALEPWVGERHFWLRIEPDVVTGRRIALDLPDMDERGYR